MNTDKFLKQAIRLIKAGDKAEAQRILEPLLETEPNNLAAWFWYVETWPTIQQRIQALEICLQHNPESEKAQYALRTLKAQQTSLVRATPRTTTATIIDAKPYNKAKPSPPTKKAGLSRNTRLIIYLAGGMLVLACLGGMGLTAIMLWQNSTGLAGLPSVAALPAETATPAPTVTPVATNTSVPTETPAPGAIAGLISWETKGSGNVFVVGVTVKVWDAAGRTEIQRTITDSDGKYEITDLPAGKYLVSVYQAASDVGEQIAEKCWVFDNVVVKPGQTTKVFMDFDNAVTEFYPQCTKGSAAPADGSQG